MTPLFRLLQRIPAVRRLEDERDGLRAEQSSIQLKLRAASAEMGELEEQCRVLRRERDALIEERRTLTADKAAAEAERDQLARDLEEARRAGAGPEG